MAPALPALTPEWPVAERVRAVFTLRGDGPQHGASTGPWGFLNLGEHVGDDPAAVALNRARLRQAMPARPVYLNQVHGTGVVELTPSSGDGMRADAAITMQAGVACTIMVADCLPVLLADRAGLCVAAAHAGWRGLAAGVVGNTMHAMRQRLAALEPGHVVELTAWLGPCIGPTAFEVGPEVREAFLQQDAGAEDCFVRHAAGKWLADLPALARRQLALHGVRRVHGNDGSGGWCTMGNAGRYHSHRRDARTLGASGRMAACIWLT